MADDKRYEGKTENLKGKFKEGAGKVSGDDQLENEGKVDQKTGKIKDTIGKAKDTVKDVVSH